jgi:hypothetical protein
MSGGGCCGYLDKYSGGKQATTSRLRRFSLGFGNSLAKWDRRYFVLHDGSSVIAYHKTQEDAESSSKPALGTASCSGSIVSLDESDDSVLSITLVGETTARVLWLRAPDSAGAQRWVDAIVRAGAKESASSADDGAQRGMLLKQVDGKSKFEKRFFKLADSTLLFYQSEADLSGRSRKPPLGAMTITSEVRVDLLAPTKAGEARCAFVVSNGDTTTYTLKVRAPRVSQPSKPCSPLPADSRADHVSMDVSPYPLRTSLALS